MCQNLRQYCEAKHEPDRFLIHHGNLSASYRESAEEEMKDDESLMSVCATATLELGIDIGRLERAFQIDAPFTVSGFLQRMGRTGRRGDPSEMWFVMREEHQEARAMLPDSIPWYLIQGIALVQLYIEERFVEPPRTDRLPYSLLYHQTMSTLASCGEMTPGELASRVLPLSSFRNITQEDYRILLRHLIGIDHISRTENGGLILGLSGERVLCRPEHNMLDFKGKYDIILLLERQAGGTSMADNRKVPKRISQTVLNSLKGGVVPRIGLPYITVGRKNEIEALLHDVAIISEGGASFRFIVGKYGSGKSFLLQTIRNYVMDRGFIVADADLESAG